MVRFARLIARLIERRGSASADLRSAPPVAAISACPGYHAGWYGGFGPYMWALGWASTVSHSGSASSWAPDRTSSEVHLSPGLPPSITTASNSRIRVAAEGS